MLDNFVSGVMISWRATYLGPAHAELGQWLRRLNGNNACKRVSFWREVAKMKMRYFIFKPHKYSLRYGATLKTLLKIYRIEMLHSAQRILERRRNNVSKTIRPGFDVRGGRHTEFAKLHNIQVHGGNNKLPA